jgi:hypothetical protein
MITVTVRTDKAATALSSEAEGIWCNKRDDHEYPALDLWTDFCDALNAGLDNGRLSFQLDGRFMRCLADTYENLLSNEDENCGEGDLAIELDAKSKGFVVAAANTDPARRTPDQVWWLQFAHKDYVL